MELIIVLRLLWRRRLLVAIGVVVAVAAAMMMSRGASQTIGLASSLVQVATPRSSSVQASSNSAQLPNHAPLLADLLATQSSREQIARAVGVPADQISVVDQRLAAPVVATPLPTAASQDATGMGANYTLVLDPYTSLPIVKIGAIAPNEPAASRLVGAATKVLKTIAAQGGSRASPGLQVSVISPPKLRQIVHRPRKMRAAAVAFVVLILWCTAVILISQRRRNAQRRRWRGRLVRIGSCALVATVAAIISVSTVHVFPPGLHSRDLSVSTAEMHLLVDAPPASAPAHSPYSAVLDPDSLLSDFDAATARAGLFASLLTSDSVVADIAHRVGVPPNSIDSYESPIPFIPVALAEPQSEKRAMELVANPRPYRLEIQPRPADPIIDIYAQAPTPAAAQRLATNSVAGLTDYLHTVAANHKGEHLPRIRLLALGRTEGVQLTSGKKTIAGLTFVTVFCLAMCGLTLVRRWRRPKPARTSAAFSSAQPDDIRQRLRRVAAAGGNWPHTTRVLPWMLAFFIAVVWLVPFDQIQLNASLPITLPLDRLILPFLIGTWLLALAVGGPAAPRLRLTWIHAAVGAFAVCVMLSVVLNAPDLNHTLEFTTGLKRIPLFISYLSLFVIVASVVRPGEVNAMLKYMLVLSLILAVGMIIEYRTAYNVFYDLSKRLLPGFFTVGGIQAGEVDGIGRRLVFGSAGHPLEAVAMLSVGLSIALVGLMNTKRLGHRVGYSLAVVLLLAAMLATYRKSALLAPLSIILTVAWFKPKQVLKLAPLAVVLLGAVHVVAPGAFGSITEQLSASRLNVPTVDDRVVRYDAVRPDVWSHILFGRGIGTYEHVAHRILDSEVLGRLVETGALGLITYFLMIIATVVVASRVIRAGPPDRARAALIGAGAAVSFGVVSFLYDTLSFPHGPYLFLCMAGFVAVISEKRDDTRAPAAPLSRRDRPRQAVLPPSSADHRGRQRLPTMSGRGVSRPL